jgi:hypothetical protein
MGRTVTCIEKECYVDLPLEINARGEFDLTNYGVSLVT